MPTPVLMLQFRDVVEDLPVFLTSPLYRRWHLTWGATPAEVATAMPGDGLVAAQYRSTRAISIAASPAEVFPWLVQVGGGRAGPYSDDLLDDLGRPSASAVEPGLQTLAIGQWIPMSPVTTPSDRTAFRVASFEAPTSMLWSKPDSTWAWQLTATDDGGTRPVTRINARYDWRSPLTALLGVVLMELGDFAMRRRMLRGVRTRAVASAQQIPPPQAAAPARGR